MQSSFLQLTNASPRRPGTSGSFSTAGKLDPKRDNNYCLDLPWLDHGAWPTISIPEARTGDEFEMCLLQDARFPDSAPQRVMGLGTTKPMQ